MTQTIAFIGGGNMAASLIGGMREAGTPSTDILVAEPDAARRQLLEQDLGITTTADNRDCLAQQIIVLAVKPQVMHQVCSALAGHIGETSPAFISIAAGITSDTIDGWLGGGRPIVRCMPNTPALLRCGATGIYANAAIDDAMRATADRMLSSIGINVWVEDEALLDSITAVSGSGPAYFFLLMEAMQQAAVDLGLDADTASRLVAQTALGAARMNSEGDLDTATLRANVTSKGGTTEQAILTFEQAGLRDIVRQALGAAHQRSIELASELAGEG